MLKPVVKWVGGKRQLLNQLLQVVNENFSDYDTYIEPFVGGGSLLFKLAPDKFVINDYNDQLINLYHVIKDHPAELVSSLEKHQINNSKEYFYNIRDVDRSESLQLKSKIEQSARFIYLNKTCFNGMYRVNSQGFFNVPFGRYKSPNIVNKENIIVVSQFLNATENKILNLDFEFVLDVAKTNDLVYFDPPYIPLENTNSFTSYTKDGFSIDDQVRLRNCALKLIKKGVNVILSNSYTPKTLEIYDLLNSNSEFNYIVVDVKRNINSVASKRKGAQEVIIWSKKGTTHD